MPLWIPVGLCAVVLWVTGNIIDKYLIAKYAHDADDQTDVNTLFLFSSLFTALTAVGALIFGEPFNTTVTLMLQGVVSGLLFGLYLILYLHAIARSELSRIIPIFQSIPIFGFIFAFLLLGETVTLIELCAAAVILSGASILSYHRGKGTFDFRAPLFILVASAALALQETLYKDVAIESGYWTGIFWSCVGLSIFGLVIYAIRPNSRAAFNTIFSTRRWSILTANGANEIVDNAATLVFSFALLLGPIALVQTINAYQPILIFLVAYGAGKCGLHFLEEEMGRRTVYQKIGGITLISIGSLFVYKPSLYDYLISLAQTIF